MFNEKDFFDKADVSRETMKNIPIYAEPLNKWQKKLNFVSETTL